MDEGVQTEPTPQLTHVESAVLFAQGILKAWLVLAVGAAAGYGSALVIGRLAEIPVRSLSWDRFDSRGPISVCVLYGVAGFLIEVLRVQGRPRAVPGVRGWCAARRLRAWLLAGLGAAALGVGLYAGLWW